MIVEFQMIIRLIIISLSFSIIVILAEFCGNNKIPFGLEVHKDGHLTLLCSRPNCHEKKYAECPERPESLSCSENKTWVGGLTRTIDDRLFLQCCKYDLLGKYGQVIFENVTIRRGEFFEGEEKFDQNDEDVISFDLISNIQMGLDNNGEYYNLTIHRYFCGKIPDTPPVWFHERQWPYWEV